jgi:dipeptidase D
MRSVLENLEPKAVWKYFDVIANTPRPSTKEEKLRNIIIGEAKRLGLPYEVDKAGNLVVRKPAAKGRESAPTTALQGHLDMVCEKNEGTPFDFDKDAIDIVRKGEWLYANGTTLGSDNGIGVAAALAVMESTDIAHPAMEFIFTIDEETGLTGAAEFAEGVLKSKYFLNLDNEEKGTICIGCAGGVNTKTFTTVKLRAPKQSAAYKIKVLGLRGGHSGVDIHLGRGNAVRILGRALQTVNEKVNLELAELKGGSAHNAIPREAWAIVTADASKEGELKKVVAQFAADMKGDLGSFDPDVQLSVESVAAPKQVFDDADARRVVSLIATLHHGILAMSPDIPGLVQTSTNVATVSTNGDRVEIITSQRSAIAPSRDMAARVVATVCKMAGFEVQHSGGYPGWKPEPNSDLVKVARKVSEKVHGHDPKLIAMHAGLECGVIGEKNPGMQMISFGPQIENPHSPNERGEIESVAGFWNMLKSLLEAV